jgi:hypothetical protein
MFKKIIRPKKLLLLNALRQVEGLLGLKIFI